MKNKQAPSNFSFRNISSLHLVIGSFVFIAVSFVSCNKGEAPVNPTLVENCDTNIVIENVHTIEGYSDKQSYFPGEELALKIHSLTSTCNVQIIRHGLTDETITWIEDVTTFAQNYNCRSYSFGCNWETTLTYTLPEDLVTGIYSARLTNDLSESFFVTFIVKNTGEKDFALLANTNTWQAYNAWGGHSFYRYELSGKLDASEIISFDRPNTRLKPYAENGHLLGAERHLHKWMENEAYDFNVIADVDLHDGSVDLSNYNTLVLNVHPEYWTKAMRDNLVNFLFEGGNIINLGANAIFWRSSMVGNKIEKKEKGNNFQLEPSETAGKWRGLGFPESKILGVEYDTRGYATYYPYVVYNAAHWIFDETGLTNGSTFGEECLNGGGASGHETDKMTLDSPDETVFLAKGSNPNDGGASMVFIEFPSGAKVFSVGSISYTGSLTLDPAVHQITKNVFEALKE